jgi:hypothetical protein
MRIVKARVHGLEVFQVVDGQGVVLAQHLSREAAEWALIRINRTHGVLS